MKKNDILLTHLMREPTGHDAEAPPLLLLLHGIGSNEHDLFGLTPYLDKRFLVVSARAPIALEPGYGWFHIDYTPQGLVADLTQAEQSRLLLLEFIDELIKAYSVDPKGVYLLGFSQGAMMSLSVALTRPDKIAGVAAMSGRLPRQTLEKMARPEALEGLPIFVAHGIYDPVIPVEYGRASREMLEALPVRLTYREYPMGHEVTMESLQDAAGWLSSTLDEYRGTRET